MGSDLAYIELSHSLFGPNPVDIRTLTNLHTYNLVAYLYTFVHSYALSAFSSSDRLGVGLGVDPYIFIIIKNYKHLFSYNLYLKLIQNSHLKKISSEIRLYKHCSIMTKKSSFSIKIIKIKRNMHHCRYLQNGMPQTTKNANIRSCRNVKLSRNLRNERTDCQNGIHTIY